jgi:diguanylate cyclase (GGDEF)-like protein/excisionase family DNA binding protein
MSVTAPAGGAGLDNALRRVVALEEEVRHSALHDPLTGLPNRTLFVDRVHHELTLAARAGGRVGVLFLGLDRFKVVNDSLGHHRGDELLSELARRLEPLVGAGNTLARLAGDEFAVLCGDLPGERGAIEVAQRLLDALAAPVVIEDRPVSSSASIGIAVSDGRRHSAEALVRDAGAAMYRAKERGGGRYELFDPAMRRRMTARLQLEDDLRRALDQKQLELFYQPLVSLDERRIVGVEALVRWRHPTQGIVLPGAFVPVAEESGLIVPLGRWVLGEACRQLARWTADPGIDLPYLSVNLSGRQLAEPGLAEEIGEILRQTGVPPERLALELTESVLMEESDSPTAVLQDLKDLGVQLMLDDFGTGYSSLNHVKRFPISAIKVDRSFIAGVAEEASDRHILRAIVNMAAALEVSVIAEGVESAAQARWLRHLGIVLAQGYALGRPAPAVVVEALLRDGLPLDRLASAFELLEPGADSEPAAPVTVPRGGQSASEPSPPADATITLGEAAEALGISTSSLRRWADNGRILALRTAGGHRRFPAAEIRRLTAQAAVSNPHKVRPVALPVEPLPAVAALLGSAAAQLAASGARAIYGGHPGWFASDAGREQLRRWAFTLAAALRSAHYDAALDATRRLSVQAEYAGASLLERHTFLERYGELAVRELREHKAPQAELVGARRVFTRLRQTLLEAVDARAAG